ncbi:MAG TPA: glycosyl hydrolase [Terracidiphilus sp.]|nr:glycosyl hydrolase [Terracidiphilus sp.]
MPALLCGQGAADDLRQGFLHPPDDARPLMRWWWFGPAVTRPELAKELQTMRTAGIGGVEIQPVYPMALDDPAHGIRNLRYLSPEFLADVNFANRTAHSLGLRVDITLGSGWPYGGPGTTPDLAAGCLRIISRPVENSSVDPPRLGSDYDFIAAFVINGDLEHFDPSTAERIHPFATIVPPGPPNRTVVYFIAGYTGMQVKRAAFGAEGNVLDHFNREAIEEHIKDVATPLLSAFGNEPPYSVFSDSLEVVGSDWTPNLPAEFLRRRAYDLIPHLPELLAGGTPQADAVRHDWGKTLSELIRENYLAPITEFARAHRTLFRSQTYGDPAVTLADEATPQLIEGEGPQWRQFSYARWATSAAHLYGRNVVSAETWTWLHSPAFRATPLDVKAEADRMFLLGVNQFVGHGWPYSPPQAGEPGWAFYAAAVFNAHNPWFPVMPDVMQYLTRVSWLLRQGKPANDVAILLPEDDAQAAFAPGHVSVTDEMSRRISPRLIESILDAGYNFDFIDAATIDKLGTIPYPILIIPPTDRIPLSTYKRIEEYAKTGKVIAVGKLPSLAPGLMDQKDSTEIAAISHRLFEDPGHPGLMPPRDVMVTYVPNLIAEMLRRYLPPDVDTENRFRPVIDPAHLGFVHRKLPDRDIYFLANTENVPFKSMVRFRSSHRSVQEWNPDDGAVVHNEQIDKTDRISIDLAPYESRVFVLSDHSASPSASKAELSDAPPASQTDLSWDWDLSFVGSHAYVTHLDSLVSWTRLAYRQNFSGEGIYTRNFTLDQGSHAGKRVILDFGPGTPIPDDRPPAADGMHALLDPPIREAAIVFVNGKRAGALWHPPYRLDITTLVHPGANQLEIRVYNTAINELAGQPPHDLTALRARYGTRFEPQDQDRIHPIPSGLLGPVRLVIENAK